MDQKLLKILTSNEEQKLGSPNRFKETPAYL